jgi:hypothetical protein
MALLGNMPRHLRYQLWWLPRLTWSVMLVVLLGGVVWMGAATAPGQRLLSGPG